MKLLSRRAVAAATFALLPLGALAVPGTASADHCSPVGTADCEDIHGPQVQEISANRSVAVVYKTSADPITVTVRASDESGVGMVVGLISSATDPGGPEFPVNMRRESTDAQGVETWRGTFTPKLNTPTGSYVVGAEILDSHYNQSRSNGQPLQKLSIKRNTGLAMNASPESVAKGAKLLVAGKLTRLNARGNYVAYGGKRVDLYFRPVGGKYTYVGSQTTNRYGRFGGPVRASQDGTWAVRFNGTSNYVGKVRRDYVDVR